MTIEETCDQMRRERDAARSQLAALRSAVDAAVARAESAEADLAVKTHALRQACLAAQTERDEARQALAEVRERVRARIATRNVLEASAAERTLREALAALPADLAAARDGKVAALALEEAARSFNEEIAHDLRQMAAEMRGGR
jgi:chromosome segregation ATPase